MSVSEALTSATLDRKRFLTLLEKLCSESKHLINQPASGHIPKEALAARHVLDVLKPYTIEQGGVLKVREISYGPDRSNIIIEYKGTGDRTIAFVGSHFDVVHADPADWKLDPFTLTIDDDGDTIHGRGTTDCLGHVALMTDLFVQLATLKPQLNISVIGVMIADEEDSSGPDMGVQALMDNGELEIVRNGPVIWLDCADLQPNIGSGGMLGWRLVAHGRAGHSGFPNKSINAIELAYAGLAELQKRFYEEFKKHDMEDTYGFPCSSSMKPTKVSSPQGSLNQIKAECTIEGDIRLVPFYKIATVRSAIEGWVKEINESHCASLMTRGESRYTISNGDGDSKTQQHGSITLEWLGEGIDGLACDLKSDGFKLLEKATIKHVGSCTPLADTGSLPLVAELQAQGLDIQTIGYGVEDAYHADNEFARVSDFETGFKVLMDVIAGMHDKY
jgi:acetylornithine deacetylase